jgi:outer membrane protein
VWIGVMLVWTLGAAAQDTPATLTLRDAFNRALEANASVGRAREGVEVADAQRRYFLSAVLPKIGVTGSLVRNSEEVAFGEGDDMRLILPEDDWSYRVILQQPIFAGRRELRAYTQAKIGVESAKAGVDQAEEGILLEVAAGYLGVVQGGELVDVETKNVELAERRKTQAQAFYDAGEVTRVEILRAETGLKEAQRRLARAEQLQQMAKSRLRIALNLDTDFQVVSPDIPTATLPDEATLLARAEASRPELVAAANDVEVADLEVSKQFGFGLPTITFDAAYVKQKTAFPTDEYSYAALRFNVPIFQSGEVRARMARARHQKAQASFAYEELRQRVRESVRLALLDLETAEKTLALAREGVAAAEAEYAETFELYQAQEATSLDVQASESALAEARRALVVGELERDLAHLGVYYATGSLKDAIFAKEERE